MDNQIQKDIPLAAPANDFAFILGFGTLMPYLSQQIYPLSVRNIEKLVAMILTFNIESNHLSKLKNIKQELTKYRENSEKPPKSAFLGYKMEYLEYIRDSSHSAGFFNFALTICELSRKRKKIQGKAVPLSAIRHNDEVKWGTKCVYYGCAHNSFKHPKGLSRALEQLQIEINKLALPYAKEGFYYLGKRLAECYRAKEYDIEYPTALSAYHQEFCRYVQKQGTKLDGICTVAKNRTVDKWKKDIIRIANTNEPLTRRKVDFNLFPVLVSTWDAFEESVNIIGNMSTKQIGGQLSKSAAIPQGISSSTAAEYAHEHPSGFSNPSIITKIGDACERIGWGRKESDIKSL